MVVGSAASPESQKDSCKPPAALNRLRASSAAEEPAAARRGRLAAAASSSAWSRAAASRSRCRSPPWPRLLGCGANPVLAIGCALQSCPNLEGTLSCCSLLGPKRRLAGVGRKGGDFVSAELSKPLASFHVGLGARFAQLGGSQTKKHMQCPRRGLPFPRGGTPRIPPPPPAVPGAGTLHSLISHAASCYIRVP